MADTKITALTAITTVDPAADVLPIVDVSDTSMAASGTTKKITSNQILGAGGTATLASATITGALTANGGVNLANATAINFGGLLTIYSDTAAGLFIRGRTVTGTTFQTQDGTNPLLNISNSGVHTFYDGAGGTRMTLNATGLGVGTSPSYKIHANGVIATTNTFGAFTALQTAGGTGYRWTLANDNNFYLQYSADGFGSTATSRISLDSSGNVGIGVTPSAWNSNYNALDIGQNGNISGRLGTSNTVDIVSNGFRNSAGNWVYKLATSNTACRYQLDGSTGSHIWYSGSAGTAGNTIAGFSTATMTLDASGTLLVGTTSNLAATSSHSFKATGTTSNYWAAAFAHTGSNTNGRIITWQMPNANDTGSYFVYATNSGGNCFNVLGNGNVQNTNGTYGTISDLRLKENIADARNYLADLLKLRVVKYSLKSEASPTANLIGLIAQEVEQVFPTLVETNADDVKSIKTTVLIPMLLKALQELAARVQTLETR